MPRHVCRPVLILTTLAFQGAALHAQEPGALTGVRDLPKPAAAALARIAQLTGGDPAALQRARLSTGRTEAGAVVLACTVPLSDTAPGVAATLLLNEDGGFAGARVVDGEDEVVGEFGPLLAQFRFRPLPKLATARPKGAIQAARARAEKAGAADPDAMLTRSLIALMGHMQDQAALFNVPRDRTAPPDRALVVQARDAYSKSAALEPGLAPLLGAQGERFAALARKSASVCDELLGNLDADDPAAARQTMRALTRSCRACHDLSALKVPGKLKDASRKRREELGIGDGQLLIGYDIRVAHKDRKRAQRVLDAVRIAALLLDARDQRAPKKD